MKLLASGLSIFTVTSCILNPSSKDQNNCRRAALRGRRTTLAPRRHGISTPLSRRGSGATRERSLSRSRTQMVILRETGFADKRSNGSQCSGKATARLCTGARPQEIGWHDVLDGLRLDAELAQTRRVPGRHVVRPEKVDLAGGQRRVGQVLEQPRLSFGHGEGDRHEQAPLAKDAERDGK